MRKKERKSKKPWRLATYLLLTCCSLSFWTCNKTIITPVLIGEARIVGKVEAGSLKWEPNENQGQAAYVVTPAFVKVCLGLALENAELKAEIKKLQAKAEERSF